MPAQFPDRCRRPGASLRPEDRPRQEVRAGATASAHSHFKSCTNPLAQHVGELGPNSGKSAALPPLCRPCCNPSTDGTNCTEKLKFRFSGWLLEGSVRRSLRAPIGLGAAGVQRPDDRRGPEGHRRRSGNNGFASRRESGRNPAERPFAAPRRRIPPRQRHDAASTSETIRDLPQGALPLGLTPG